MASGAEANPDLYLTSMRLSKNISQPELLALLTPLILVIPNIALNFTEHLSPLTSTVNVILPLSVYFLITTSFRKIGITVWCLLPIMIYCGFQIVLLYLYGRSIIGVDMFLNVVTSNATEIAELLGNLIMAIGSLVIVYIPALVFATIFICKRRELSDAFIRCCRKPALTAVAASAILLTINYASTPDFAMTDDVFPVNVTKNLCLAFKRHADVASYPETSSGFRYDAKSTHPTDTREIYVMVIGETSRADNWQLLGYGRETNPRLKNVKNLVAMPRALTQSATTHKSVPMLLSPLTAEDFDSIAHRKSIITAFKEAGFYTSFFSNQRRNHSYTEYFGNEADRTVYLQDRNELQQYDGELIELLREQLTDTIHRKQFIVLHTYGSHFNYQERYPAGHSYFKPDDKTDANRNDRPQLINAYDNTIRYIDSYLADAISALNRDNAYSALIYASDHGEDIFDDRRGRFLHASPIPTYYQLHVPMFVWISDTYADAYPCTINILEHNGKQIVSSTASLYNTMIELAGIDTPYFDETSSVANTTFKSPELIFLSDRNEAERIDDKSMHPLDIQALADKGFFNNE